MEHHTFSCTPFWFFNCSLARGPGDTQEGSLWLSPMSVVPAMSVIPSAGLALPGSGRAPFAHLHTHSGLILVEQEGPQSRLDTSAPFPEPCSLHACSKSSPRFCQSSSLLRGRGLEAPTAHAGVTAHGCFMILQLLMCNSLLLGRGLRAAEEHTE